MRGMQCILLKIDWIFSYIQVIGTIFHRLDAVKKYWRGYWAYRQVNFQHIPVILGLGSKGNVVKVHRKKKYWQWQQNKMQEKITFHQVRNGQKWQKVDNHNVPNKSLNLKIARLASNGTLLPSTPLTQGNDNSHAFRIVCKKWMAITMEYLTFVIVHRREH